MSKKLLCKCHEYEPDRIELPVFMQPKLNGVRSSFDLDDNIMRSYDEKKFDPLVNKELYDQLFDLNTEMNATGIVDEMKTYGPGTVRLDGEMYKHGWSLQRINGAIAVKRVAPKEDTKLVGYHMFDVALEGFGTEDRLKFMAKVARLLAKHPARFSRLFIVPTRIAKTREEAEYYHKRFLKAGYEGSIYRLPVARNKRGLHIHEPPFYPFATRSWHILKRKPRKDAEFEIVDTVSGRDTDKGGKYKHTLGAIICKTKSGHTFNVGSGFDDAERDQLWADRNVLPGKMLKVEFLEYSDKGIPKEPTSLGIRESWQ